MAAKRANTVQNLAKLKASKEAAKQCLLAADKFLKELQFELARQQLERAKELDPSNIYIFAFQDRIAHFEEKRRKEAASKPPPSPPVQAPRQPVAAPPPPPESSRQPDAPVEQRQKMEAEVLAIMKQRQREEEARVAAQEQKRREVEARLAAVEQRRKELSARLAAEDEARRKAEARIQEDSRKRDLEARVVAEERLRRELKERAVEEERKRKELEERVAKRVLKATPGQEGQGIELEARVAAEVQPRRELEAQLSSEEQRRREEKARIEEERKRRESVSRAVDEERRRRDLEAWLAEERKRRARDVLAQAPEPGEVPVQAGEEQQKQTGAEQEKIIEMRRQIEELSRALKQEKRAREEISQGNLQNAVKQLRAALEAAWVNGAPVEKAAEKLHGLAVSLSIPIEAEQSVLREVKLEMYSRAVKEVIAKRRLLRSSSSTLEWLRRVYQVSMAEYLEYESKFLLDLVADQYRGTILLVSKSIGTNEDITPRLKSAGYVVVQASTPESALEKIEKVNPNLILCDTEFPESFSGIKFLHFVRANSKFSFIPFILIGEPAEVAQLISSELKPNEGVIRRPVKYEELMAMINEKLTYFREYVSALS